MYAINVVQYDFMLIIGSIKIFLDYVVEQWLLQYFGAQSKTQQ